MLQILFWKSDVDDPILYLSRQFAVGEMFNFNVSEHNMALTNAHADQIATLLNERNQLTQKLTCKSVLDHADNYICRFSDANEVVACVEVKSVQWYQTEILHLTVANLQTRKGYAKALLHEAERGARAKGARLLQCTIRESNTGSRTLFESFGFLHINTFNNPSSGNNVMVFQKVLLCAQ